MSFKYLLKIAILSSYCLYMLGCQPSQDAINLEQAIASNANGMQVYYQVISNTKELDCLDDFANGQCYQSELELVFTEGLPSQGWQIYFSHLSPIQTVNSDTFAVEHINGDLHRLSAKKAVKKNETYKIGLISAFWSVSKSDVLPNYYFAYGDKQTAVIRATQELTDSYSIVPTIPHAGSFLSEQQIKRNKDDNSVRHDAEFLFLRNQKIKQVQGGDQQNYAVIPRIQQQHIEDKNIDISDGLFISKVLVDAYPAAIALLKTVGVKLNDNGLPLGLTPAGTDNSNEYSLTITTQGIQLAASEPSSVFYGLISIGQMANHSNFLPTGTFVDSPRYDFRGVHLDVARNFRSVAFIETLIKEMAWLKLNKLHLHLADDEGWRLEIDGLPELTNVGAYRCHDPEERTCLQPQLGSGPDRNNSSNGFYTVRDYQYLLQLAAKHHIEIIPSLDMPGHSRAAIKAMEARYFALLETGNTSQAEAFLLTDFNDETHYSSVQHYNDNTLNPCLPSTFNFVETVLVNLVEQHKRAGVPLKRYHIGADETAGAWHESPVCKQFIAASTQIKDTEALGGYFIERIAKLVEQQGIIAAGWSDGMREFSPKTSQKMQVNVWDALMWQGHDEAQKFANQNWHTVLSYPDVLYFDFPYSVDPNEPGYYWASRATDSYKVFQFIPDDAGQNARLWLDRQNRPYQAQPSRAKEQAFEGIQAHLWSEIVRHDDVAFYMYFPRLISFAQQAWYKPEWQMNVAALTDEALTQQINQQWRAYSQALVSNQLSRLSKLKVPFRIPPPGAVIRQGQLQMNHLYDGMHLQYKRRSGEWQTYTIPVQVNDQVSVRALLPHTQNVSAQLTVNATNDVKRGNGE